MTAKVTMAHLPGGGPLGAACRDCAGSRAAQHSTVKIWCQTATDMTRRKAEAFDGYTAACKYFQAKEAENV